MAIDAYVLDAHPIVGSYRGESFRPFVQSLIRQARQGQVDLRLTTVNAGEIVYGVERALGRAAGEDVLQEIQVWTHIVAADLELSLRAGWFRLRGGISYADCFAAALAHRDGLPLITGDPEFRQVEDVIHVVWLDTLAAG